MKRQGCKMNTPIISPIWFYMMDAGRTVDFFASLIMAVTTILLVAFFVGGAVDNEFADSDFRKAFKIIAILLSISAFVSTAIPSQDTMMKMLIAQNITYERVEGGKEMVKDTVDYIFEKIDENKKGE